MRILLSAEELVELLYDASARPFCAICLHTDHLTYMVWDGSEPHVLFYRGISEDASRMLRAVN